MKKSCRICREWLIGLCCCFLSGIYAEAQSGIYDAHGWQLKDYRADSVFGASVEKAYAELLKGKQAYPVIVAVIDGGVDTAHEDLTGHIWINAREIPGNGIDDDHNGYVDDTHGWNYLGGKNGKNITNESYESYREYFRLNQRPVRLGDTSDAAYRRRVYIYYKHDSLQQSKSVAMIAQVIPQMRIADSVLKVILRKDSVYAQDVIDYNPVDSAFLAVRNNTLAYFRKYGITRDMSLGTFILEADKYLESSRNRLQFFSGDPNALRREIVGDDYDNPSDTNYGNNNVAAGNPSHGTHVSGIIAATRGNGKGMDGIDARVYIMALRAVPDGDERDKDIARAIRYAVDNGARIVNMSFGKYLSPGKKWVDDALRYAADHDVLLVHAAGNESVNLDSVNHFPTPQYEDSGRDSCCFITVAANAGGPDSLLPARFSNYGNKEVDLFAPGVRVYSTLPGNMYAAYSGTSMAAPMVSGIAALLLEYYPRLSARQLKSILLRSAMKPPVKRVKWLATGKALNFDTLSATGGIVNAYNALQMAAAMTGDRKNP